MRCCRARARGYADDRQNDGNDVEPLGDPVLRLETNITVDALTAGEIFDFLIEPSDEAYQRWWPGVHLHLHLLERAEGHVGDVVYMDEYIGKRRVRMSGIVIEAVRGQKLAWQLKRMVRLPVRLSLELRDEAGGVVIRHRIEAGFTRLGRVLDPLWRLFFSKSFTRAMDEHVRTEFPLLRDRLGELRRNPQPAA